VEATTFSHWMTPSYAHMRDPNYMPR